MRQFQTSVLELREVISDGYSTQPFECAWAARAIFFFDIDSRDDAALTVHAQISPDGLRWLDEGTACVVPTDQDGFFLRVGDFGGWLRLRFSGSGTMTATIRLVLKE
jgi:hypothetical protein